MAMKARKERIAYPTKFPPERLSHLSDKIWLDTPESIRFETARMCSELELGIAIRRDRLWGNPKYSLHGFYGLTLTKQKLYYARMSGDAKAVAKAERRLADLEASLKDAIEAVAAYEYFYPLTMELCGLEPMAYLRRGVEIEQLLRTDFTAGIFRICDEMGMDFLEFINLAQQIPPRGIAHAQ